MNGSNTLRAEQACPAEANEQIRKFRKQVAESWIETPDNRLSESYRGELGKTHRKLLSPDFKVGPLSGEESAFAKSLTAGFKSHKQGFSSLQQLLAAMLYLRPYQMPVTPDIQLLPSWFQEDYFEFLLESPLCFWKAGETDQYFHHISGVLTQLRSSIIAAPDSNLWKRMALIFLQKANLIPLYFCQKSLRDIYVQRGEIVGFALKAAGFELDYSFPPQPFGRKKIRLGIHMRKWVPYTEGFASLPVFASLDRNKFEIFLYVHLSDGNPMEQYARSLADRFVVLPEDVRECAAPIRADDLDVLFFCNNSTAVTNPSLVLESHRLARRQYVHFCNPGTTGLRYVDYFVVGSLIHSGDSTNGRFSERLLKLKGSGICFEMPTRPKLKRYQADRGDFGIPEECTLFVSGANFFKITPELRLIWALIVAANPEFVLAMYPFGPAWSSKYPSGPFVNEMKRVFEQYGISRDRLIVLKPFRDQDDIKAFLGFTDVYLDAVPYSGATSLLDPLMMGVPPVVMEGSELRFCQGAAMLREIGMRDLIANSEEEYVQIAVRLATDAEFRRAKSDEILRKMQEGPPFLDSKSYAQEVGRALESVIRNDTSSEVTA